MALLLALLPVLLAACAPDAWRPDKPYDIFLDQVQGKCGAERIGNRSIGNDLLSNTDPDAYFLDVTSRFYHREISEQDYVSALSGSFAARTDSPGILCVLSVRRSSDPLPPLGIGM